MLQGSGGAVRDIVVTQDGRTIAIATYGGPIYVGTISANSPPDTTWVTLAARANHLSLTSDGLLVAACVDGSIWLYSIPRQRWLSLQTGNINLGWTVISDDGRIAVVLDS